MLLQPPLFNYHAFLRAGDDAIQAHTKAQGYGLIKVRSKTDKAVNQKIKKVWYKCAFGGEPLNTARERKTTSFKTNCPMRGTLTRTRMSQEGHEMWLWETNNPEHNHPPLRSQQLFLNSGA
jgi:hypothetical protein